MPTELATELVDLSYQQKPAMEVLTSDDPRLSLALDGLVQLRHLVYREEVREPVSHYLAALALAGK